MPAKTAVHEATEEDTATEVHANGHTPTMPDLLSFDDIIAADDIQTEYVSVPEWGGRVRVRSLSGEERGHALAAMRAHGKQIKDEDEANTFWYARIIAESLIDGAGKRIAGQSKALALTKKNGAALTRIYKVCARLSGIGQEEEEQAREDLKADPSDSSGTD